jgi:hypothetical protein
MFCRSCSGITANTCNSCNTFWTTAAPSTCTPNPALNYYLGLTSPDITGGTLTVSPSTQSSTCTPYTLYGWLTTGTLTVSSTTGITQGFFQMIVYFGLFTVDSQSGGGCYWNSQTAFFLQANDGSGALNTLTSYPLFGSTRSASTALSGCYSGRNDHWNKISQSYAYSTSNQPLTFGIYYNETNASNLWGIKEFIIIYKGCNWACTACYGPSSTQCSACLMNSTITMWQSNNTCSTVCLKQFGYVDTPNICITCDVYCKTCYNLETNCSACTTSGTFIAYLMVSTSTCLAVCGDPYF